MQSVQRRFGKLLPRTADESQIAVLLKDFDEADKMLTRVCYTSRGVLALKCTRVIGL